MENLYFVPGIMIHVGNSIFVLSICLNLLVYPKKYRALIEILWSDLTFKQQNSWIYRSAGTPVLLLSRQEYSEVAMDYLRSGKSGNFVA